MTKRKNKTADLSVAYFGTPRFSVWVLEELEKAGIVPAIIVTQPDKPKGRGLELAEPPVKTWALEHSVLSIQPKSLSADDPDIGPIMNSHWDLFIVAAYGKIIPMDVLKLPRFGTLNVHPSLLPRYRGPSPIESQILADDRETGVTIMLLDEELDHGPIVAQASITPEEWPLRASILEEILARAGGELLAEAIPGWIEEGMASSDMWVSDEYGVFEDAAPKLNPEPQDHAQATFTKKIEKEDGLIELSGDGYQNYLKFCAYDEWPGIYFFTEKGGKNVRVKINDAQFENGIFTPLRVTPEGRKEMNYADFVRAG